MIKIQKDENDTNIIFYYKTETKNKSDGSCEFKLYDYRREKDPQETVENVSNDISWSDINRGVTNLRFFYLYNPKYNKSSKMCFYTGFQTIK